MSGKHGAAALDRRHEAGSDTAAADVIEQDVKRSLPLRTVNLLRDALVSNDPRVVFGQRDVNQYPVTVLGMGDAANKKLLERSTMGARALHGPRHAQNAKASATAPGPPR